LRRQRNDRPFFVRGAQAAVKGTGRRRNEAGLVEAVGGEARRCRDWPSGVSREKVCGLGRGGRSDDRRCDDQESNVLHKPLRCQADTSAYRSKSFRELLSPANSRWEGGRNYFEFFLIPRYPQSFIIHL